MLRLIYIECIIQEYIYTKNPKFGCLFIIIMYKYNSKLTNLSPESNTIKCYFLFANRSQTGNIYFIFICKCVILCLTMSSNWVHLSLVLANFLRAPLVFYVVKRYIDMTNQSINWSKSYSANSSLELYFASFVLSITRVWHILGKYILLQQCVAWFIINFN